MILLRVFVNDCKEDFLYLHWYMQLSDHGETEISENTKDTRK